MRLIDIGDFLFLENKIKTDLLWNSLIFNLYSNRVTVNSEEIDEQLRSSQNKKKFYEFLLSDIIIKPVETGALEVVIKELETKMKESQEKIKNITVEGISGTNSVKVVLNGEGEIIKIDISPETMKEAKTIIEDLIMAAHNNAKLKLKSKTSDEISKAASGIGIPGFKWPI